MILITKYTRPWVVKGGGDELCSSYFSSYKKRARVSFNLLTIPSTTMNSASDPRFQNYTDESLSRTGGRPRRPVACAACRHRRGKVSLLWTERPVDTKISFIVRTRAAYRYLPILPEEGNLVYCGYIPPPVDNQVLTKASQNQVPSNNNG